MNTENSWLVNLARNQNSLVVVARLSFCKTAGHTYHIMNTTRMLVKGTSRECNVLLSEAFGKGSD